MMDIDRIARRELARVRRRDEALRTGRGRPDMLCLNQMSGFGGIAVTRTFARWNPSDKSAGVTLSNENRTGSYTNHTNNVRATIGKQTGKWYYEFTIDAIGAACAVNTGVWALSTAIDTYIDGTSGVYRFWAGGPLLAANDVVRTKMDMDAGQMSVAINGGVFQTVNFTVGGVDWYPVIGDDNASSQTVTYTANFGATTFAYSVPSGYNAGLYV